MDLTTADSVLRFCDRVLPGPLRSRAVPAVGGWAMRRVPDRRFLERRVLPHAASLRPSRVLFVGISRVPDTRHYERDHDWGGAEFWTMDIRPEAARWGSSRHRVGDVRKAGEYFGTEWFDCVILNGVFGWGLDDDDDQEHALAECRAISRPGSLFVLGWNASKARDPRQMAAVASSFDEYRAPGLPSRSSFRGTDHVIDLLTARPAAA